MFKLFKHVQIEKKDQNRLVLIFWENVALVCIYYDFVYGVLSRSRVRSCSL